MVALEFNPLYYSLLVLFSALIPGVAIGVPFLKKSDVSILEKLLLCFFIGLVAAPTMLILENVIGIKFSLFLVLANLFILTAAGIFAGIRNGAFSFKAPQISLDGVLAVEFAKKHAASFFLLMAVLLAFWIRLQPYSPIYSELDPYFYVYGSGQIIRFGEVPRIDDTAWWPEVKASHRDFPSLKMYTEAQWYALYSGGGEYNNYLLYVIASWLPPIAASLMAFGAYLLFSSYYGKKYGLLAAFLAAFLPVTIFKMSAGVNEAAPFGMAAMFFVLGFFALALKKKDWRLAAVASLAFSAAVIGSNYEAAIAMPIAGFIVLQALDYYMRGRNNQDFLLVSLLLVLGFFFGNAVEVIYSAGAGGIANLMSNSPLLMCVAALAFAYAASEAQHRFKVAQKKKIALLAGAIVLMAILILAPNPVGSFAKSQIKTYIGAADFNFPLQRTIAEQNQAGGSFESESGFLALVPKNYIVASPSGPVQIAWNTFYGALDLVSSLFSLIGNLVLQLASSVFNALLGTYIETGAKDTSMLFVFLILGCLGLVADFFLREGDERDEPSMPVLLLLLMLPIMYIGLNKIKFTIFVGIALVVAAVAAVASFERIVLFDLKRRKAQAGTVRKAFAAACVLLVLAEIAVPGGYSLMILGKSFEMRYQDNSVQMMPKLAKTCEGLRQLGYYDQELCAAGYNESFADTINGQFNGKVCLVSQLSMKELIPGNSTAEQEASGRARAGASFRCNRLGDYWVDSMEWIRNNLNDSDRVTSWWDYGHWINYFGDRKTVLRNEHASTGMIGRVAHDYILGSTQDLIESMNYFDSRYVLFDVELIGGDSFGGKYGALNYLGCAHEGGTTVRQAPGTSDCEFAHSPERLMIPKVLLPSTSCIISESQQRSGVVAYLLTKSGMDQNKPAYCVGEVTLATGEKLSATYYIDRKDANGDLVLSKGFLRKIETGDQADLYEVVYNELPVWPDGKGGFVGGMEDAKTAFYRSNLYKGFYLENLPGFDLVYKSKGGEVKIYRMKNFTGNKEGWVDPAYINRMQ